MGKSIIVTGATGTAGSEVILEALNDSEISSVTAIVRRPLSIAHPKLKVIVHKDFMNYARLEDVFKQSEACVWCLGISQTLVTKEEYIHLTYDYALAAAKAMLNANPNITFLFLSGMGADSNEKSRTLFAWVKGKTENALKKLPFKHLYIVRPGGIVPSHPKPNSSFKEKIYGSVNKVFGVLLPSMSISSANLAKAMLNIVKKGSDLVIHENKDLQKRINS
jgi:uncharacterized protein YbjT (DUF2867 family)